MDEVELVLAVVTETNDDELYYNNRVFRLAQLWPELASALARLLVASGRAVPEHWVRFLP
jgi:hypothetical protein